MVDEKLFQDLLSFDIPILAVGDHGQLPPVGSEFSLMSNPDIKLEKLHRYAENNTLIKVGMLAREEGKIPFKVFSDSVQKIHIDTFKKGPAFKDYILSNNPLSTDSILLCAYNKTRQSLNTWVRKVIGMDSETPISGDRVICLKNNKKASPPIYNGQLGVIKNIYSVTEGLFNTLITLDGYEYPYEGVVDSRPFAKEDFDTYEKRKVDFFDYGYCITTHKSQGSQFERVLVVEQECSLWEHSRWLYTACSRASQKLLILGE
jgi:exodeoxyribonuclease-5